MKTGILWDLDGTLLDTLEDLMDATNHVLAAAGYPRRSREEIRAFVGNGAGRLLERAAPAGADTKALLAQFQSYYTAHCRVKTKPYDGIPAVLEELGRRYPMAIVSNKPDAAVKALCAEYFPGIFALGETPDCPRKPDAAMVRKAMAAIGVERCVYVGDSEVDVRTAKNAGVPCVSVLWGFRDEAELRAAGGNILCPRPEALPEILDALSKCELGGHYGQ